MSDALSDLLLTLVPDGKPVFEGATCTAWNATTFENTVKLGSTQTYTNCPVVNPAAMSVGDVLLANTLPKPIILGRISLVSG